MPKGRPDARDAIAPLGDLREISLEETHPLFRMGCLRWIQAIQLGTPPRLRSSLRFDFGWIDRSLIIGSIETARHSPPFRLRAREVAHESY